MGNKYRVQWCVLLLLLYMFVVFANSAEPTFLDTDNTSSIFNGGALNKSESESADPETTTESSPSVTTPVPPTTPAPNEDETRSPWVDLSTVKLIILCLISLSIPVAFMTLLMWRVRRDRKYMDPRNGALVYRETIIVPSYTIENTHGAGFNVVQMHNTLFDTPPAYDTVVKSVGEAKPPEIPITQNEDEDAPPPTYSSVHI